MYEANTYINVDKRMVINNIIDTKLRAFLLDTDSARDVDLGDKRMQDLHSDKKRSVYSLPFGVGFQFHRLHRLTHP